MFNNVFFLQTDEIFQEFSRIQVTTLPVQWGGNDMTKKCQFVLKKARVHAQMRLVVNINPSW